MKYKRIRQTHLVYSLTELVWWWPCTVEICSQLN